MISEVCISAHVMLMCIKTLDFNDWLYMKTDCLIQYGKEDKCYDCNICQNTYHSEGLYTYSLDSGHSPVSKYRTLCKNTGQYCSGKSAGTVYGYRLNYTDSTEVLQDGVFRDTYAEGDSWGEMRLSFQENQCYLYTAAEDSTAPTVTWEIP